MKKQLLILVALSFICFGSYAQKVAGYFPSYRSGYLNTVKWDKLTDCYFAFINAGTNGDLIEGNSGDQTFGFDMTTFLNVKSMCTANNVRLHISVGGADGPYARAERFKIIARNATARNNFATKIVAFAITHNLAGINIDWEFPNESVTNGKGGTPADHYNLINAVRTAINASSNKTLKLGVAVGGEYTGTYRHTDYIASNAVSLIDEFHIMSYDFPKGGGNTGLPYDANHHATTTDAIASVVAWNTQRGVPFEKMLVGVPFYGRRADRTTDDNIGMYNSFSNAAPSTIFNDADGVYTTGGNTWYYDSKPTLDAKIASAMAKGCQGIFAWDLGQDRGDAYSLLGAIKDKMATICPIPDPNMGPDKGFCTGSVVLDPAVPTQSSPARTFTWQKDGVNISGYVNSTTANTYTTNTAGTYTVIINQGSGCSKTDEIKVVAGSGVTAAGVARCGSGAVTMTITNPTGTFDWYNAQTGGSKVFTGGAGNNNGKTITTNVTGTTDYWVQENTGSVDYTSVAKTTFTNTPDPAWNESSQNENNTKPKFAQQLTAYTDLTLTTVRVFTNSKAINGAKIVIYKADGTVQAETTPVTIPETVSSYVFNVAKTLPGTVAGTVYYVGVYSTDGTAATGKGGFTLDRNQNATAFAQANVYKIEKFCYRSFSGDFGISGSETTNYGQLFDWTITTGVASPCGRTKVTATVNTAPSQSLAVAAAVTPICVNTNGAVVVKSSENNVNYDVYKGATKVTALSAGGTGADLSIPVDKANLAVGNNVFSVRASSVGCTDLALTNTATIAVTNVPANPGAISGSGSVTQGQSNVTYTVPAVATATSYTWTYTGSGATFTATTTTNSVVISFGNTATGGNLSVTPKSNCGSSAAPSAAFVITVSPLTSVDDVLLAGTSLTVYPNPVVEGSKVVVELGSEADVLLTVSDILGNVVATLANGSLASGTSEFTLPQVASGIYLVKLQANGHVYTQKVVKGK